MANIQLPSMIIEHISTPCFRNLNKDEKSLILIGKEIYGSDGMGNFVSLINTNNEHKQPIEAAFTANGFLFTIGKREICKWKDKKCVGMMTLGNSFRSGYAVVGDLLFVAIKYGYIEQWDIKKCEFIRRFDSACLGTIRLNITIGYLFISDWNIIEQQNIFDYSVVRKYSMKCYYIFREFIFLSTDEHICQLNIESGLEIRKFQIDKAREIIFADGFLFAASDHKVRIWNMMGDVIADIAWNGSIVIGMVCLTGKLFIQTNNMIRIYNIKSREIIKELYYDARFQSCDPLMILIDQNVFIADNYNNKIIKINLISYHSLKLNWPRFTKEEKQTIIFIVTLLIEKVNKNALVDVLAEISL